MNPVSLFPDLTCQPTGLARLAAESENAGEGHDIEFRSMKVRSVLNKSSSRRWTRLAYSINPYRGCEFGCRYCYARYTHDFLAPKPASAPRDGAVGTVPGPASVLEPSSGAGAGVVFPVAQIWPEASTSRVTSAAPVRLPPGDTLSLRDPDSFERLIFLKMNAAWLLEQELKKIDPADEIALGTATDPYQPIERRARITRSLLEVFARYSGHHLGIVTKSTLIARDIDLLTEIARRNTLTVHLTITTADAALARKLEPRAPRPDLRFATVRRLRQAGIRAGILCSPLLPGITDSEDAIDGMARRAAAADASFFAANPLFLKPCSRPTYLRFVREHFPALIADYERRFGSADFAAPAYRNQLAAAVTRSCRRYRIAQRSEDALGAALLPRDLESDAGPREVLVWPTSNSQRIPPASVPVGGQHRLFG